MPRSGSNVDQRVALDKAAHFLGTASIRFENLSFPQSKINRSNVNRIKTLMQGGRACLPGKSNHQISAIVDKGELEKALIKGGISPEVLLRHNCEYVKLEFPDDYRLHCLQGHHRVIAASELPLLTRRWVVKLYSSEIKGETRLDLQEERSNEKDIEDGEFYYNIRLFEGYFGKADADLRNARKWWALLAGTKGARAQNTRGDDGDEKYKSSKCDRLRQLFGHRIFAAAFDSFRYLPALYAGLRLSVVNKMLSMICMDELLAILNDILSFWCYVFEDNKEAMGMLDVHSLRVLDCTAPGANETERSKLGALSASCQILGSFSDTDRGKIWSRICDATKHRVVPTLWGFFDNLNHLRPVAACLARLTDVQNHSLRHSLSDDFSISETNRCLVQVTPNLCKSVPACDIDCFKIAYRQLWLYAWREYQWLQPTLKKKLAGTESKPANAVILWGLARLAHKLGFMNPKIDRLLQNNPHQVMARRHLRDVRIPGSRKSDVYERCVDEVANCYASAWELKCNGESDSSEDEDGNQEDLEMECKIWGDKAVPPWQSSKMRPTRCGLPRFEDHLRDKALTFIHHMDCLADNQSSDLSSFFTLRSLYSQIFSDWKIQIDFDRLLANAPQELDEYLYSAPLHKREVGSMIPEPSDKLWDGYHEKLTELSAAVHRMEAQHRSEGSRLAEIRHQIEADEARANRAKNQKKTLDEEIKDRTAKVEDLTSQIRILEATTAGLRERMDEVKKSQGFERNRQEKMSSHDIGVQVNLGAGLKNDRLLGATETNEKKEDAPKIQRGEEQQNVESSDHIQTSSQSTEEREETKLIKVSYSGPSSREELIEVSPKVFRELAKGWINERYLIFNKKRRRLNPDNGYHMLTEKEEGAYRVFLQHPEAKRKLNINEGRPYDKIFKLSD